ncbi:MAG: Glu/Leu/Phe/Val dehydrogenase [Acidimicrobiia bacterium]|nr:Glu/Leu/Phe/Val dehydrogenase [Acidimicrobiia bacterium]
MGVFDAIGDDHHERVVVGHDPATGLRSIIAIYSTDLGPALGGTRLFPYHTDDDALTDALRLSKAMALKASAAGLNLGGGKAVIIGDRSTVTPELWRSYGRFVDSLAGAYITAEDVGTTTDDMHLISEETRWVVGRAAEDHGAGDPSPATARGVVRAMKAVSTHLWNSDSLRGSRVAVQGVGKVGSALVEFLTEEEAEVVVADVRPEAAALMAERFGAKTVPTEEILFEECGFLAPCSLGGALSADTIPQLRCRAVVGSANNQLAADEDAARLAQAGILYVPDFVANAAGLIHVSAELDGFNEALVTSRIEAIYDSVLSILQRAAAQDITPHDAAIGFAEDRIRREGNGITFRHGGE